MSLLNNGQLSTIKLEKGILSINKSNIFLTSSSLRTRTKLSSCLTGSFRKEKLGKGVILTSNIVFIKMKDTSVYSFNQAESESISKVLKK